MDEIETFLKEYNNELLQSSTSDDMVHPKIVGNYKLDREDVSNQIIDWVLHYLETRKCPYQLAVAIAKNTAQQIDARISEQSLDSENLNWGKLLNSVTLYTEAIKRLPDVCNSFVKDMDGKELCSSSCSLPYTTSVYAIKNKRRKMEDRHVIHHNLNSLLDLKDAPIQSYYAVFDGHSGVDAASYASAHLHVNIAKQPDFSTNPATAIAEAYKITDENFLKKCSEENIKSGSTVICALIREKTVYLSWLGDSQAVLVKEGKPVIVTDPHKPERADERQRIEDLGGEVTFNTGISRVNGILAVTRALGDPDHKKYISSEPEITTILLDGTEDFLILACDGLWDGMSPEDVTTALYYDLSGTALDKPLDAVAAKLVHQSKLRGSEDNITAIVIFLREIEKIKEYAKNLLPQACSQLNFLEVNGEEKDYTSESNFNASCTKPTVLEFSAASAKKLKNAANVLSSAGITDSSYACTYSGSAVEGMHFQSISSDAIPVPHPKIASCLAPEATALSELPTPPIDDVLASQQFEKLCSSGMYQGSNPLSLEPSGSSPTNNASVGLELNNHVHSLPDETQNPEISDIGVQDAIPGLTATENVKLEDSDITPEEAVDIASCVVSNTIETAMKQISSSELHEASTHVPTQKLNPYAEPFVMKSFVPGSPQPQTDTTTTVVSDGVPSPNKVQSSNEIGSVSSLSFLSASANTIDNDIVESHGSCESPAVPEDKDVELDVIANGIENSVQNLSTEGSQVILENTQPPPVFEQVENFSSSVQSDQGIADVSCDIPTDAGLCSTLAKSPTTNPYSGSSFSDSKLENSLIDVGPDYEICPVLDGLILQPQEQFHELNAESFQLENVPISPGDRIAVENATSSALSGDADNVLASPKNVSELKSSESSSQLEVSVLNDMPASPKHVSDAANNGIRQQLSDGSTISNDLFENTANAVELPKGALSDLPKSEALVLNNVPLSPKYVPEVENSESLHLNNVGKILNDILTSPQNTAELQNYELPDQLKDPALILNSIAADSQGVLDVSSELVTTTAVLSGESVDECPAETLTVDLRALPDGIPEAEGVTEDVDSDSEKDGGWSYMKGNNVGSGKSKPKEPAAKVAKLPSKSDTTLKPKEVSKHLPDIKSKLKTSTSLDKSRKPILEKKALDPKDKSKIRSISSTLPKASVDKTAKSTSTISKSKKELLAPSVSKTAAVASTKSTRMTTLRNTVPLNKPTMLPPTERSQLSSLKPVSSSTPLTGNSRPKSALTNSGIKPTTKPASASAPLSKGPSTNQRNKSNVASSARNTLSRPVASAVPSRTVSKPSTLVKSTDAESRTKPVSATMKKTIPPVLKKPDVKEAKDAANKQISARKNILNKTDAIKTATVPTKNASTKTLSNKSVPAKAGSASIRSDLSKKDVPKATARLPAKSGTLPKISQNAATGKEKKILPVQEKSNEKKVNSVVENEQNATETTPLCEEEKFILEVNDKEMVVKEQDEIIVNSNSQLCSENNLVAEVKPPANLPSSESLL